jgi:hypothetical protein
MNIRPFLHKNVKMRVDKIGTSGSAVMIIDNFLLDADRMVDYAATEARFGPATALYPGIQAPIPAPYPHFVHNFMRALIPQVFGLGELDVVDMRSNFSMITLEAAKVGIRQRIPHMDLIDPNHIVLLHYLYDDPMGGTAFYRHKATGFEQMNQEQRTLYEAQLKDEIARHPQQDYISGDTPIFDQIACFPAVFNRAIVYRSTNLHAACVPRDFSYSEDPREGRLTANNTFYYGDAVSFFGEGARRA